MTEQEQKQADLAAKYEAGTLGSTDTVDDKHKKRTKAASEWVQHFNSVVDLIEEADGDVDITNTDALVALLVQSWEDKSDQKDAKTKARAAMFRKA